MAITRRPLKKQETEGMSASVEESSCCAEAVEVEAGDGGCALPGGTPSGIRMLRGALKLGRKGARQESAEPAAEEEIENLPVQLRPSAQKKMGYISPVYASSRSVTLNPRTLSERRCVWQQTDTVEAESYRQLRTRIMHQSAGSGKRGATIMVTSALAGEGKTLTAINLAFTFAREFGQTALLVDGDLRKQQVHRVLDFASDRGLVDYLLYDCPVSELFVWPGVEKLSVISGGRTVKDSCELLGSPGMKDLVEDMRTRYPERYVIFDVPPVLTSADALAFAPLVDYVVVVAQAGSTSLKDVNRALSLLPAEKVLGLVMNRY